MTPSLLPLRLHPGDDLRASVEAALRASGQHAGFVLQGIGSLSVAQLRYAGRPRPEALHGDLEILTLAGSLAADGAHLHMTVADAQGRVLGGHVCAGCVVRTTAELLLALLPEHRFRREHDARTGYPELQISATGQPARAVVPAQAGLQTNFATEAQHGFPPARERRG